MLFDFLNDVGNHDERKVDRYKNDTLTIDTAYVSDGTKPFETAVAHPSYNERKWVIVESYDNKDEAQIGHDRWVRIMTTDPPTVLVDCCNAEIGVLCQSIGSTIVFEKGEKV